MQPTATPTRCCLSSSSAAGKKIEGGNRWRARCCVMGFWCILKLARTVGDLEVSGGWELKFWRTFRVGVFFFFILFWSSGEKFS